MNTNPLIIFIVPLGIFLSPNLAHAKSSCPGPVLNSLEKAYPGAKVSSCVKEKEKGEVQYEIKLETKGEKKLEVDAKPEGNILQVEENVALDSVPKAVLMAFETKYPKVHANRFEKQTKAQGAVTYELAFKDKGKKHEVTFAEDGSFIEME